MRGIGTATAHEIATRSGTAGEIKRGTGTGIGAGVGATETVMAAGTPSGGGGIVSGDTMGAWLPFVAAAQLGAMRVLAAVPLAADCGN